MDRISDLRTFVRLTETLSFSRTATVTGLSRASVGRVVERLEADLGTRLVQRTTRRVVLTPDGGVFRDRCLELIAQADGMRAMFATPAGPRGVLRVNVPSRIGRRLLMPHLPEFLARHPMIDLDLSATDRPVDLIAEGFDCVVRVGEQRVSNLVSRRMGDLRMITCASPAYLARHGTPATPHDLTGHRTLGYVSSRDRRDEGWEWIEGGRTRTMRLAAPVRVDNAELYIAGARAGLGLIQVPAYDVADLIASGALVEILRDHCCAPMPVALVAPDRPSLVPGVAAFAHWLEEVLAAAF